MTVELDHALRPTQFDRAAVFRLGILVDQRERRFRRRQTALDRGINVGPAQRARIISIAVTKETKLPTVVWSFDACLSADAHDDGDAGAAKNWTSGDFVLAEAIVARIAGRRCSRTDLKTRLFVGLAAENLDHLVAFDGLLQHLVILPIDSCWPRAILRRRLLKVRTTMAMKGTTER